MEPPSYLQSSFQRIQGPSTSISSTARGGRREVPYYEQLLKKRLAERDVEETLALGLREFRIGAERVAAAQTAEREARDLERERFFSGQAGPWGSAGQPRSEAQWRQSQFQRGTEEGQQYGRQQAEAYRGRGLEGDYRQTMQRVMENERRKPFAF